VIAFTLEENMPETTVTTVASFVNMLAEHIVLLKNAETLGWKPA
jgi:hypothetical protein